MTLDSIRICWFVGDNYACGTKPAITGYLSFPFFFFYSFLSFLLSFCLCWKKKGKGARATRFRLVQRNATAPRLTNRPTKESVEWHTSFESAFSCACSLWNVGIDDSSCMSRNFSTFFFSFLFFSFVREKVRLEEFVFFFFVLKEKNNLTLLRIILFSRC